MRASGVATTPEVISFTSTYRAGTTVVTSNPANVTVTAVQMNSLLNYNAVDNAAFLTYVMNNPAVSGVNVSMDWASVEGSGCNGTCVGQDTFANFDSAVIAPLFAQSGYTKKINIIVQGVSGGCALPPANCGNSSTPDYVFSTDWATNVNNTNTTPIPLHVWSDCGYGISNAPGFPAVVEPAFYVAYQGFMKRVLNWYSSSSTLAPYIGYIRFGLSAGGEVYPFCEGPTRYSHNDWLSYVDSMDKYVSGLHPSIQLMTSINQTYFLSDFSYADAEASFAVTYNIGFGSQGLQYSDTETNGSEDSCTSQSSTSDWCWLFNGPPVPSVPLELQTTLLSDPGYPFDGLTSNTGSLAQLIPFALSNHAEIFELYAYDMLYAFDNGTGPRGSATASYCNLNNADTDYCSNGVRTYPSCYSTLIQQAENGVMPTYQANGCTPNQ